MQLALSIDLSQLGPSIALDQGMKKLIVLAILQLIYCTNTVYAADKCTTLFQLDVKSAPSNLKDSDTNSTDLAFISAERRQELMQKWNYQFVNGFLYKNKVVVGKVTKRFVKYFYEWQDQESHDYWIEQGKFSKEDMNYAIEQDPQTYGAGYYVSLDPIDSNRFGSHLTVFKVNKEIELIQTSISNLPNRATTQELRELGFTGILGTNTWINVFNEQALTEAVKITPEIYNEIKTKKIDYVFKHKPAVLLDLAPHEFSINDFYKISHSQQKKLFKKYQYNLNFFISNLKFQNGDMNQILQFLQKLDAEDYSQFSKTILSQENIEYLLNKFVQNTNNVAFFELFDTFDIATMQNPRRTENLNFEQMKQIAEKYAATLKATNFQKIDSVEKFKSLLNNKFELSAKTRDFEVQMQSHLKGSKLKIKSTKALQDIGYNYLVTLMKAGTGRSEYEIDYFSLKNLDRIKNVFNKSEIKQIKSSLQHKNEAITLKLTNDLLLKKLFNPKEFSTLCYWLLHDNLTPQNLQKIFISLHPFADGNGRSSRIYYRWLLSLPEFSNNITNDNYSFFRMLVADADFSIKRPRKPPQSLDSSDAEWIFSRLYLMSAKDDVTRQQRAREILSTGETSRQLFFEDMKELLN